MVRCEPGVYGRLASEPTASRVIQTLGGGADKAARAINKTSACVRERAWDLAGSHAPDHACTAKKPLIIDLDATLLTSHSDKEQARPTLKRGYGFHPLCAFVDHGQGETGEPRAVAAQHVRQRFSEGEYVWSDAFTVGTTESITGPETSLRETIEAPSYGLSGSLELFSLCLTSTTWSPTTRAGWASGSWQRSMAFIAQLSLRTYGRAKSHDEARD